MSVTTVVGLVLPVITRLACETIAFEVVRADFLAAVRRAAVARGLLFFAAFLAPFLALLVTPALFFLPDFLFDFLVAIWILL